MAATVTAPDTSAPMAAAGGADNAYKSTYSSSYGTAGGVSAPSVSQRTTSTPGVT
jgi:hypothetical protein